MKKINFTKLCAAGNDFIIIDNRDNFLLDDNVNNLVQDICRRKYGIGADGVMFVENSDIADFKMRILNPDGSEVDMCGNGARGIAMFAYKKNIAKENMSFETMAGIIKAEIISDDRVKLKMSDPYDLRLNFDIEVEAKVLNVSFLNTGVEHVVSFVDNIETFDVKNTGVAIRYHEKFAPAGTNVNFVSKLGENKIKVRTYERGVEDETLACGTGSIASAIIAGILCEDINSPVSVLTQGGEELIIDFKIQDEKLVDVYMQGNAKIIYEGII